MALQKSHRCNGWRSGGNSRIGLPTDKTLDHGQQEPPPPGLLRAPRVPRRPRPPARPVAGHPRPRLLLRLAQERDPRPHLGGNRRGRRRHPALARALGWAEDNPSRSRVSRPGSFPLSGRSVPFRFIWLAPTPLADELSREWKAPSLCSKASLIACFIVAISSTSHCAHGR